MNLGDSCLSLLFSFAIFHIKKTDVAVGSAITTTDWSKFQGAKGGAISSSGLIFFFLD